MTFLNEEQINSLNKESMALIIIQNYSMKQRFLRMILKNLISMKSSSLTKGKRKLVNEKLIYLIFQQGYSNHTLSEEELNEKFPEGYYELPARRKVLHVDEIPCKVMPIDDKIHMC